MTNCFAGSHSVDDPNKDLHIFIQKIEGSCSNDNKDKTARLYQVIKQGMDEMEN